MKDEKPTQRLQQAVDELGRRNRSMGKAICHRVFISPHFVVVTLRPEPAVIEGVFSDVPRPSGEIDIFDLMADFQSGRKE